MDIGVLTEIKTDERRVALTPEGAAELVGHGHRVVIQRGAGAGAGLADEAYQQAGAEMVDDPNEVFGTGRLILHVKEPQPTEIEQLGPHHVLFTFLHLAAYPDVARGLLSTGCTAIGYETVELTDGHLPLLAPMSRIAGRMAVQAGAHHLEATVGGKGVLLGGYPGVPGGRVTVLGAGTAGLNAVDVAVGLGARVAVLDIDQEKLDLVSDRWGNQVVTVYSTKMAAAEWSMWADVVVGAVLVPGRRAPTLVTREMLADMADGSVLVDISIDQGGCFETSRETTHADPTFVVDGIVHYAVGNIPGAVPVTSTRALTNATLPYVVALAEGVEQAVDRHPELAAGVNLSGGKITNDDVALALERSGPTGVG